MIKNNQEKPLIKYTYIGIGYHFGSPFLHHRLLDQPIPISWLMVECIKYSGYEIRNPRKKY